MNAILKILISGLIILFVGCSDSSSNKTEPAPTAQQSTPSPTPTAPSGPVTIKAKLDMEANRALTKGTPDTPFKSVFEAYQFRKDEEDYDVWTEKLFGDCCTEVDMLYSETLKWQISSDIENPKYPVRQLTDTWFTKAYVFKETQQPKIDIRLDLDRKSIRGNYGLKSTKELLNSNDTIAYPLDLSLVNGYTKSLDLYKNNGRVKALNAFHNGKLIGVVELMDSPEIQRFNLQIAFMKEDVVTLQPISFYKGLRSDDVCISEIQSCVCESGYKGLNQKYSAYSDEK